MLGSDVTPFFATTGSALQYGTLCKMSTGTVRNFQFFEKKITCLMPTMIQGDEYCSSGISI
jgi:hypothetical protein